MYATPVIERYHTAGDPCALRQQVVGQFCSHVSFPVSLLHGSGPVFDAVARRHYPDHNGIDGDAAHGGRANHRRKPELERGQGPLRRSAEGVYGSGRQTRVKLLAIREIFWLRHAQLVASCVALPYTLYVHPTPSVYIVRAKTRYVAHPADVVLLFVLLTRPPPIPPTCFLSKPSVGVIVVRDTPDSRPGRRFRAVGDVRACVRPRSWKRHSDRLPVVLDGGSCYPHGPGPSKRVRAAGRGKGIDTCVGAAVLKRAVLLFPLPWFGAFS